MAVMRMIAVIHVVVVRMPENPWSIAGTVTSLIALTIAFWTVRQGRLAAKDMRELRRTMVKPVLRVSESNHVREYDSDLSSLAEELKETSWFHIDITNIGPGPALYVDPQFPDGAHSVAIVGDTRFLISPEDARTVTFNLDEEIYDVQEGSFPLAVFYEDIEGNRYKYTCDLKYGNGWVSPSNEKDNLVCSQEPARRKLCRHLRKSSRCRLKA